MLDVLLHVHLSLSLSLSVPLYSISKRYPSCECEVISYSCLTHCFLFVRTLSLLLQYMRSFRAAATTSQPVLALEDIDTIFYKIPDLYDVHVSFIQHLKPKIKSWNPEQEVANAFKVMVSPNAFSHRIPGFLLFALVQHQHAAWERGSEKHDTSKEFATSEH